MNIPAISRSVIDPVPKFEIATVCLILRKLNSAGELGYDRTAAESMDCSMGPNRPFRALRHN